MGILTSLQMVNTILLVKVSFSYIFHLQGCNIYIALTLSTALNFEQQSGFCGRSCLSA